ncbi:MAG TPA: hypothetical protein VK636_01310, partial [Gemmatimonadaceae bacterium]|nr:hypothetical protein [Gemmatimonadaceae bacterium]
MAPLCWRRPLLGAFVLGLASTATTAAQASDAGARMERVADGVYVIIHDNATENSPHSNTG